MIASHPTERTPIMSALTVHFTNAAVEVDVAQLTAAIGAPTSDMVKDEARRRLAMHFGPCALDYDVISDRRNVSDLVDWAGADAETDAFYLRATGAHGWFNRASWKITQTG
jgi:hypothetical protein